MYRLWLLLAATVLAAKDAQPLKVAGLQAPVEVLRDRWGVPHIYAKNTHDLFFAQGYITAGDRLWQLDLWRRRASGRMAEVLGPDWVDVDRRAHLMRYRGDWQREWASYGPEAKGIIDAFTAGVNAYIKQLPQRPAEFARAGFDPGLWQPADVVSRMASLEVVRNATREVERALNVKQFGAATAAKLNPPEPAVPLTVPAGLNLDDITPGLYSAVKALFSGSAVAARNGSNNWVVDGTRTASGKPLLANDPHRALRNPGLRKTVHLVAPGWNIIGAGEPALPGIALGHNEEMAFGFTIVGIDQSDIYVEELDPQNHSRYRHQGQWRQIETERVTIPVRGQPARTIELQYTVHGPVIHEEPARHRAYSLKWVGAEPGAAGYLPALRLSRARNWQEFRRAMAQYKTPSENMIYADRQGNIGWIAAGLAPVRKGWTGLLPVPGDGRYEWQGYLTVDQHPQLYNPPSHQIATANHNILPTNYPEVLGYEWSAPHRYQRILEMLQEQRQFTVADFARMQADVLSIPARRFQAVVRKLQLSGEEGEVVRRIAAWDARMTTDSVAATLYRAWYAQLPPLLFGTEQAAEASVPVVLAAIETQATPAQLREGLRRALITLHRSLGNNMADWRWGRVHQARFPHLTGAPEWARGPLPTPGEAHTVNAASGEHEGHTAGASYRQVLDPSDWDKSVITNTPGEVGDPASPHYADLLQDWAAVKHHPLPYTRKAVEAATESKLLLIP